jgi:putative glycosyltransferase
LEFYTRIKEEAEKVTENYEIILVNDGSPDDSLDIAISLHEQDGRVGVIDLSRNFGHHKAIMTGLTHAKGALVFLIDCDLEEDPELLGRFYTEFQNSNADVVYGVQEKRKGGFFERNTGAIYWKLFHLVSSYPMTPNQLVARLMTQRYVANLIEHQEREIFLPGLWAITGFNQVPIMVRKHGKGSSTYTLRLKVSQVVDSITSFSSQPLVYIFYLGSAIMLVSSIAGLYLIVRRLFIGIYLPGWPSLIVSIWFLGGLIVFCLGVIGIYLSKIFMETKRRPYTVIRKIYEPARGFNHDLQSYQYGEDFVEEIT